MRYSVPAVLCVLFALPAFAQPILPEPPPVEAFAYGLVRVYEGRTTHIQQRDYILAETCSQADAAGAVADVGCFKVIPNNCTIYVNWDLPLWARNAAYEHFVARCVGWTPPPPANVY